MFSLTQRFQKISNQAITYGCFIVAFIVATAWFQLTQNDAFLLPTRIDNIRPSINIRTSRYYGSTNGKAKENSRIVFDLDTDLSPLFNWNTKQVFVYLTAEYHGSAKPQTKSEVTFWDKIIPNKEHANLKLHDVKSKYSVWDLEEKLDGRELTFKLRWNIQPWVGPLIYGETVGNETVTISKKKPSN